SNRLQLCTEVDRLGQLVRDGLPLGLELAHGVDVHDVPATGGGSVGSVVLLPTLHVGLHATSVHPLVVLLVLRLPPGLLFWRPIPGPARGGRRLRPPRWPRHAPAPHPRRRHPRESPRPP